MSPMILHITVHISMKEQWITPPNQEILHHCSNKRFIKLLSYWYVTTLYFIKSNYSFFIFSINRSPERIQRDKSSVPVQYKILSSPNKKSPKPINYKTPSPVTHKSPRPTRFQPLTPPIRYQTPSPTRGRSSTYTPDRKRGSSQHKSRSRSRSRSHSRSRRRRWVWSSAWSKG